MVSYGPTWTVRATRRRRPSWLHLAAAGERAGTDGAPKVVSTGPISKYTASGGPAGSMPAETTAWKSLGKASAMAGPIAVRGRVILMAAARCSATCRNS
jgi:hypothetical protein